jgi:hypothetical protein
MRGNTPAGSPNRVPGCKFAYTDLDGACSWTCSADLVDAVSPKPQSQTLLDSHWEVQNLHHFLLDTHGTQVLK